MENNFKPESNPSILREQGGEFAGRRTVIKGLAASAPVILTLTSGNAAAQASAFQCVVDPMVAPPPSIPVGTQDVWARYQDGNELKLWYANTNGEVGINPGFGVPVTQSCYASFLNTP